MCQTSALQFERNLWPILSIEAGSLKEKCLVASDSAKLRLISLVPLASNSVSTRHIRCGIITDFLPRVSTPWRITVPLIKACQHLQATFPESMMQSTQRPMETRLMTRQVFSPAFSQSPRCVKQRYVFHLCKVCLPAKSTHVQTPLQEVAKAKGKIHSDIM